tara:strand:- start:398 stop:841 length:444 start_codon:yes stop_codon:yes gene_type:complete
MKNVRALLIPIIVLLIIVIGLFFFTKNDTDKGTQFKVATEKNEYAIGETLKINIENGLDQKVCFSSCIPYYIEKKNQEWTKYSSECTLDDIIELCIDSQEVKAFEIVLPDVLETGSHRITIPVCQQCSIGDQFQESNQFSSNQFIIQ